MAANLTFTADLATDRTTATAPVKFSQRIAHFLAALRPKTADEQIGEFIETNGGVLTDDLERQISRRFGHMVR